MIDIDREQFDNNEDYVYEACSNIALQADEDLIQSRKNVREIKHKMAAM